jgi:hypothetical protein
MRHLLVAAVVLSGAGPAFAAGTDGTVTRWHGGQWTVWRIDRPSIGARITAYPDVRLRAHDVVTLDAGGCVSGAVIWLPGASGPVPLAGLLRRPITIPDSAEPDGQALRLGFGACAGGEPAAFVFVAVQRVEAAPAPMDLVWGATDTNGVPLNPQWGQQVNEPGSVPDATECFSVPGYFDNPLCSTQHPPQDTGTGLTGLICSIGAETPIAGHVNWYPSTFEGPIFWDSLAFFDRDYNMQLVPPTQNGLTVHNAQSIKGEFDSRETINHFSTPWWAAFRAAPDALKRAMVDGKAAIISGLIGIDCEHGCPSELHPVWVLAIHGRDDPQNDVWAVFVRNWGNEGFCSHLQHEVNWAENRFTLALPWRTGATSVQVDDRTTFKGNMGGISGGVREVPGVAVRLTIELPPPSARGLVHGELHLRWSGDALDEPGDLSTEGRAAPPARAEWARQGGKAESQLEELAARLSPATRELLEREPPEARASFRAVPVRLRRITSAAEEADASASVSVTSRPDPVHAASEERRLRMLLEALGGEIPGPIAQALERKNRQP